MARRVLLVFCGAFLLILLLCKRFHTRLWHLHQFLAFCSYVYDLSQCVCQWCPVSAKSRYCSGGLAEVMVEMGGSCDSVFGCITPRVQTSFVWYLEEVEYDKALGQPVVVMCGLVMPELQPATALIKFSDGWSHFTLQSNCTSWGASATLKIARELLVGTFSLVGRI